jgi:hypothetical protein
MSSSDPADAALETILWEIVADSELIRLSMSGDGGTDALVFMGPS